MRVQLHDFSGHPFQAELSRSLARAGHEVTHVYAEQYVGGKGHLEYQPGDDGQLRFRGVGLDLPFMKYSPLRRLRFERAYAKRWITMLKADPPDVVIACNLPLYAMYLFSIHARLNKLPYVLWHQDIYSNALTDELHRRLPRPLARLGGRVFSGLEHRVARRAAHVVAIGDAFTAVYPSWNVKPERVSVIPNWAPLDKVFPVGRTNRRSAHMFPDDRGLRLVYAGTLGRKHNPDLLVELMRRLDAAQVPASMAVVSQGDAADDLSAVGEKGEVVLRVLPFQPADNLPDVLGAADVLVALLEPDATRFSIPSKVLSYMAAGRPILGIMPDDNPAATDIVQTGGHVVPPTVDGVASSIDWLTRLAKDPDEVAAVGRRSREVAEAKFDIDGVTARFDAILRGSVASGRE